MTSNRILDLVLRIIALGALAIVLSTAHTAPAHPHSASGIVAR